MASSLMNKACFRGFEFHKLQNLLHSSASKNQLLHGMCIILAIMYWVIYSISGLCVIFAKIIEGDDIEEKEDISIDNSAIVTKKRRQKAVTYKYM